MSCPFLSKVGKREINREMSFSIIVNKQASSPVLDKVAPELKIKDVQEKTQRQDFKR